MLNARFAELTQKPDAPFVLAFGGRGGFLARTKEIAFLSALVKEDGIERGLQALLTEAERVARFGFTETELARQKANVLRNYERLALEKENTLAASRAGEYVRNFLIDETFPVPMTNMHCTNASFPRSHSQRSISSLVSGFQLATRTGWWLLRPHRKAGLAIPDETKLAAIIKDSATAEVKPYVDTVSSAVLLESLPAPGKIVNATTNDKAGLTIWQLANGVKVVLKPTTFRADEILFRATSPGGTSLVSDADYIPASTATQVITSGGVAKFSAIELGKMLAGKVASATPYIGELEEGLTGTSSRKDLETMFQLIYLRFTQPRADANAFAAQATQAKTFMNNQSVFRGLPSLKRSRLRGIRITRAVVYQLPQRLTSGISTSRWPSTKIVLQMRVTSLSTLLAALTRRRSSHSSSVISAHFLRSNEKRSWKDIGVKLPAGVIEKRVEKGIEPKSRAAIVFSGPFVFDQEQTSGHQSDVGDTANTAVGGDSRRARRHLRHYGRIRLSKVSETGILDHDTVWLLARTN